MSSANDAISTNIFLRYSVREQHTIPRIVHGYRFFVGHSGPLYGLQGNDRRTFRLTATPQPSLPQQTTHPLFSIPLTGIHSLLLWEKKDQKDRVHQKDPDAASIRDGESACRGALTILPFAMASPAFLTCPLFDSPKRPCRKRPVCPMSGLDKSMAEYWPVPGCSKKNHLRQENISILHGCGPVLYSMHRRHPHPVHSANRKYSVNVFQ